jgi:hypothetical protein
MFEFTCIYLMHNAGFGLHSFSNIFQIIIRPSSKSRLVRDGRPSSFALFLRTPNY